MPAVVPEESLDEDTDETGDGLAGKVVMDRYRVLRLLGEGGMGAVYEARHQGIDKRVVIKVLHPELASDPELVERFKREARAATAIGNEHIVDVTDMGELPDGSPCIVMELLKGKDLAELLEEEPMLSIARTVHIIDQVCDALQAAHDKGIVHRDLKPDNVFLIRKRRDGDFVKVLDFGISKMKEADELNAKLTQTGVAMGTPMYMSPEQAQGLKSLDHRTDIYAVGVMIFEMLAGDPPFTADSYPALLLKMMAEEAPRLSSIRADVPEEISDLVHSMLAKQQGQRPSSMEEIAEVMIRFKDHEGEIEKIRNVHVASPGEMETMPSFSGLAAPIIEPSAPSTARHGAMDPADHGLTVSEAPDTAAPEIDRTTEVPRPAAEPSSRGLWIAAAVLAALAAIGGVFLWQSSQSAAVASPPEAEHGTEVRAQIRARPAEARIFLDDVEFPNPMDVARERSLTPVRLRIEYDGFRTLERLVVFDQDRSLEYELSRAAAPAPAPVPAGEELPEASDPTTPEPGATRGRRPTTTTPPAGRGSTGTTSAGSRDGAETPTADPPRGGADTPSGEGDEAGGSGVLGRRRIRVEF